MKVRFIGLTVGTKFRDPCIGNTIFMKTREGSLNEVPPEYGVPNALNLDNGHSMVFGDKVLCEVIKYD